MQNFQIPRDDNANFQLFITGYHNSTTVTVTLNKAAYQKSYLVGEGGFVSVKTPIGAEIIGNKKSDNTLLIQADNDISVALMYRKPYSVATMTLYPVQELGSDYYVLTPSGTRETGYLKEFAVIAGQNRTTVDIHLKGSVLLRRQLYEAGSKLTVSLEPFQAIQLQSSDDLSGTRIQSSEPVAVLSGHACVQQNSYCDHVVEQLLPVSGWGNTFIVPALFFQTNFDIAYVIAAKNTLIRYQLGFVRESRYLEAGQVNQFEIHFPNELYISADAGIQVLFFFTGVLKDNKASDPFLINIPAITSYGRSYHFEELTEFKNSVTIIAQSSETSRITRDQRAIETIQWREIPDTLYSWGTYDLEKGARSVSLEHPDSPFGVLAFGIKHFEGYGFAPAPSCSSGNYSHIVYAIKAGFYSSSKVLPTMQFS